jgi:hypothetical protein
MPTLTVGIMAMVAEDEGLRISSHEGGAGRREARGTKLGGSGQTVSAR